jgi:hypothetical protein
VTDDAVDGRIGFEVDGRTLRIRDAVEGEELSLRFDREPRPQPALPELFPAPVDRAVSFEAESVSISSYASVMLRDADGELVARLTESMEFARATYYLDISGVTKGFVRIPDVAISATGTADLEAVELVFDRPTTVTVGARSLHTRPEATITVPDDPTALAEAVSVLGSSIKELTPERSWPTLRGYPPRIRLGDELDIPGSLVVPDTGVEVVVRPAYEDIYRLSTLAYYLGANVVVDDAPAIRFDNGYVESLPSEGVALEDRVEELLRTWFFLDTLARTEGYHKSDRYEYEQVGPKLPFYPPNLTDLSMSERLMEYLEVSPETVKPHMPEWPTEAVLRAVPDAAEFLPHLAHVLAPIRVRGSGDSTADTAVALATSPWMGPGEADVATGDVPTPDESPIPSSTAVLIPDSYENRLTRTTTARGDIRIVVLTESVERARAFRRALSVPAVPCGIDSWEVMGCPDADAVTEALSDPEVDIAYCSLPIEDGRVMAANGTVSFDDLGGAPSLVVFDGVTESAVGTSVVDNGGVSSILAEVPLDPGPFRSLIGLLSFGVSTAASIALSGVGDAVRTRIVGDPGIEIASHNQLLMQVVRAWSESPTSHRVERGSVLSLSARIGTEQKQLFDEQQPMNELSGKLRVDGSPLDSSDLFTLLNQDDSVVQLNGRLLLPEDVETEADIARLARQHLSEDAESADSAYERRSQ